MFDVGCAFILRRNVSNFVTSFEEVVEGGNVGHLTCSFATIAKSPISPDGWEPSNKNCMSTTVTYPTILDPFSYYPSLCKSKYSNVNAIILTIQLIFFIQFRVFAHLYISYTAL